MKHIRNFKLFEQNSAVKYMSLDTSDLRMILDIISDIDDSDIPHKQMFYIGDVEANGSWFNTFDINKDKIFGVRITFENQSFIDNKSVIQAFFNRLLEIIHGSDNKIYVNFFSIKKTFNRKHKRYKIIIDGIKSSAIHADDKVWNMDSINDLWTNITDMGDLDIYISSTY